MSRTILLYGATGYSGRLIAAEFLLADADDCRLVLAGRDHHCVRQMAEELDLEGRVFALDDEAAIAKHLGGIDTVINAAGPFATTALPLARAALAAGCSYTDINGEADVYRQLDRLDAKARDRDIAIVCSAGFWAAASDLLLDRALAGIRATLGGKTIELGPVRIGMSRIMSFSPGSAATVWRCLRETVIVAHKVRNKDGREELVLGQEPTGKLERAFDFRRKDAAKSDTRIASLASLVDTLAARHTAIRNKALVARIESYIETGLLARMAYQAGALAAPLAASTNAKALAVPMTEVLGTGPTAKEREHERHVVLLDIEDAYRTRLVDWRWETPNVYQFTAQLVVAVALRLAAGSYAGCLTPAQILADLSLEPPSQGSVLRGCRLERRAG